MNADFDEAFTRPCRPRAGRRLRVISSGLFGLDPFQLIQQLSNSASLISGSSRT